MKVRRILLERFMSHDRTVLDVPSSGLVLVTGPNGSGKSAVAEAVSHALYGKGLRGDLGWREEEEPSRAGVVLECGDKITRQRHGGSTKVLWSKDNQEKPKSSTATKVQKRIDKEVLPFEVWRRSAVFSSSDAATFTMSTDGERKRLLESILGLGRFDEGLKRCRDALKTALESVVSLEHKAEKLDTKISAVESRLAEAQSDLRRLVKPEKASPPERPKPIRVEDFDMEERSFDFDAAHAQLEDLKEEHRIRSEALAASASSMETNSSTLARIREAIKQEQRRRELLDGGSCPTCRQSLTSEVLTESDDVLEDLRRREIGSLGSLETLKQDRDRLTKIVEELDVEIRSRTREIKEATQYQHLYRSRKEEHEDRVARAKEHNDALETSWRTQIETLERQHDKQVKAYQDEKRRLTERCNVSRRELVELEDEQDAASMDLSDAREEVDVLRACEVALGLKGIRAHVLGDALRGIEAVANYWLAKIAGEEMSVTLRPYSTKSDGRVKDEIALDIEGCGNGRGYKASSAGERRRIDVALLLAMAEISRTHSNEEVGTLFFDEVFDALDDSGKASVSSALRELAETRCVIVITHDDEFANTLLPDHRWQIAQGEVST